MNKQKDNTVSLPEFPFLYACISFLNFPSLFLLNLPNYLVNCTQWYQEHNNWYQSQFESQVTTAMASIESQLEGMNALLRQILDGVHGVKSEITEVRSAVDAVMERVEVLESRYETTPPVGTSAQIATAATSAHPTPSPALISAPDLASQDPPRPQAEEMAAPTLNKPAATTTTLPLPNEQRLQQLARAFNLGADILNDVLTPPPPLQVLPPFRSPAEGARRPRRPTSPRRRRARRRRWRAPTSTVPTNCLTQCFRRVLLAIQPDSIATWGVPHNSPPSGEDAPVTDERADVVLLKFLRARDFHVRDAHAMLLRCAAWRAEFCADSVLDEDFGFKDLEGVVAHTHGWDRDDHPVCYNAYSAFKDRDMYDRVFCDGDHLNRFLRWRVQVMERGVRALQLRLGGVNAIEAGPRYGAHFPHVAQLVALSGGYTDDEDHGEWFLYTGSGGRDLNGNKRTNKEQSSDQKFEKLNAALRISCLKGYPVRVVRSHEEKRSSYAPESGVRYIFVRCDNEPAPWTSDVHGDRPRPLAKIKELQGATDKTERKGTPSWEYDEKEGWKWMKPPPISRKPVLTGNPETDKEIQRLARRAHLSVAVGIAMEGWPEGAQDGIGIVASILLVASITATSDYQQSLQFKDLDKEKRKILIQVTRNGFKQRLLIDDLFAGVSEGSNYQNKSSRKGDSVIRSGKQSSTNQSSSQRSSRDNSSNHSFSVPFGIPLEIDVQDGSSKKIAEELPQGVPLSCLAMLNNPAIPVLIWLQDNVGWGVSFATPTVLMVFSLALFMTSLRLYRNRKLGVSSLTSLCQVAVAAVRKWYLQLPDDNSLLYMSTSSPLATGARPIAKKPGDKVIGGPVNDNRVSRAVAEDNPILLLSAIGSFRKVPWADFATAQILLEYWTRRCPRGCFTWPANTTRWSVQGFYLRETFLVILLQSSA